MNLNNWVDKVHETAKEKGWWEKPRTDGELCQLFVSEVAEATEEARSPVGLPVYQLALDGTRRVTPNDPGWLSNVKPEGEAIELVDVLIRLGDYFGHRKFNLGYEVSRLIGCTSDPTLNEVIELLDEKEFSGSSPLDCHFQMVREIVRANRFGDGFVYAQVFVTVLNYMKHRGWNIQEAIELKQAYNETRSHRHGGKLA